MSRSTPDTTSPPAPVAVSAPEEPSLVREAKPRGVLCPFCGEVSPDLKQCRGCRAFLDPLSRQASQNEMGPWFVRDPAHPFRPGCSFTTIRRLVERGKIVAMTVIRGPTTRQAWSFAGRTPSVANLLGLCHNCQREVHGGADAFSCPACGVSFAPETNRQHLGLAPVHLLPGQALPEEIASALAPPFGAPQPAVRADPPPVRITARAPALITHRRTTAVWESVPTLAEHAPPSPPSDAGAGAWRARVVRLRIAVAVLLVVILALAGVVGAMLYGVRLDRWFTDTVAGIAGRERTAAPTAPVPTAPDPVVDDGEGDALPPEPPPAETGGEPAPVEPRPPDESREPQGTDAPPPPPGPPERGLSLADKLLPLLTREPLDVDAVRAAADRAGNAADAPARAWVGAADRRAALLRLRSVP